MVISRQSVRKPHSEYVYTSSNLFLQLASFQHEITINALETENVLQKSHNVKKKKNSIKMCLNE